MNNSRCGTHVTTVLEFTEVVFYWAKMTKRLGKQGSFEVKVAQTDRCEAGRAAPAALCSPQSFSHGVIDFKTFCCPSDYHVSCSQTRDTQTVSI